jgi:hypothetical protein
MESLDDRRIFGKESSVECANLQNSLYFSLFAGNFSSENGSISTASPANKSGRSSLEASPCGQICRISAKIVESLRRHVELFPDFGAGVP